MKHCAMSGNLPVEISFVLFPLVPNPVFRFWQFCSHSRRFLPPGLPATFPLNFPHSGRDLNFWPRLCPNSHIISCFGHLGCGYAGRFSRRVQFSTRQLPAFLCRASFGTRWNWAKCVGVRCHLFRRWLRGTRAYIAASSQRTSVGYISLRLVVLRRRGTRAYLAASSQRPSVGITRA